jgi:serine/threonine protein kinase
VDSYIGRTVSHYKILERLGEGGMGVVYKAEDETLKRTVALKFLPPALGRDTEANARFMHEAQAASALDHPNICTIHEIGHTDDGQLFICMAFYDGETLKEKIRRGPFRIAEAVDIATQTARGLARAHDRGIIHRDIKPANILLTSDGTAKIVDFGLAKLSGGSVITKEGTTPGTVYYMSPEQVHGEAVDRRTDIWSLGVLIYEMVTGRRPFEGEYEKAVFYSIENLAPEPVTALRTGVPMELERIITKCLEKKPDERYQRLDEFLVDIRTIMKGAGLSTKVPEGLIRPKAKETAWKRPGFILISSVVIALILSGVYWLFRPAERNLATSARRKSIAVLPFTSITKGADDEIFADGIHDDILIQLSKIRDMRVIGRMSMVQYKDTKKRLRDIGKELEAGYILEGTVRRSSNTIRITAQLIESETEGDIWADGYDRSFANVFAIQSEIARKIASSLRSVLSPQEETSIGTPPTSNEEAYEYYLKGNYYWYNIGTARGNRQAAEFYQKATELDPGFAIAHACVSMVNIGMYYTGQDRSPERILNSEGALARASLLAPDIAEVHHARGLYFAELKNEPEAALKEYRLALEKQPGAADVMFDYAYALVRERKLEETLTWLTRGLNNEPMALFSGMHPEVINVVLRNWTEALRWADLYISCQPRDPWGYYEKAYVLIDGFGDLDRARTVLDDESKYASSEARGTIFSAWPQWRIEYFSRHFDRALACLESDTSEEYPLQRGISLFYLGRKDEARGWFVKARKEGEMVLSRNASDGGGYRGLGMALAWLGQKKEALAALEKCLDLTPPKSDQWLLRERREELLAEACAITGEYDRALDQITHLLRTASFLTPWKIRLDPVYDPIRNDPRIRSLLTETR